MNRLYCGLAAITFAAVVLAGCGADTTAQPAAPTPATAAPPTAAGPAVEGTWRSDPITRTAVLDSLRSAGLLAHLDAFLAVNTDERIEFATDDGTKPGVVVTLKLSGARWNAWSSLDSPVQKILDTGNTYTIDGDKLHYTHPPNETVTYRWSEQGDVLRMAWVTGETVLYKGVPGEAFARVFYTSTPFHREDR